MVIGEHSPSLRHPVRVSALCAQAAAEEAMDAAKESHRALVQRLHEISALQDDVRPEGVS